MHVHTEERKRYVTPTASYRFNRFLTQYIVSFYEWNSIAAEPPPGGVGDGCNPPWQLFGPAPSNIPGYNPNQVLGGIY
jgi:hypothetical protein